MNECERCIRGLLVAPFALRPAFCLRGVIARVWPPFRDCLEWKRCLDVAASSTLEAVTATLLRLARLCRGDANSKLRPRANRQTAASMPGLLRAVPEACREPLSR
jgi:hypothetical protein